MIVYGRLGLWAMEKATLRSEHHWRWFLHASLTVASSTSQGRLSTLLVAFLFFVSPWFTGAVFLKQFQCCNCSLLRSTFPSVDQLNRVRSLSARPHQGLEFTEVARGTVWSDWFSFEISSLCTYIYVQHSKALSSYRFLTGSSWWLSRSVSFITGSFCWSSRSISLYGIVVSHEVGSSGRC